MKSATIREIRKELQDRSPEEIAEFCLRLGRFKKDNKELLSYLLFEAQNEPAYIQSNKQYIDEAMAELNTSHVYYIKKGLQKILRQLNKNIRYSGDKQTTVEILLYFCKSIDESGFPIERNTVLLNLYERQKVKISKILLKLHEDLQADYQYELNQLT
ncbi:MAG: hypothetical protein MK086_10740 [Flavobacteriales bacterium]|nr:hypothetical protein [Flavobacteriales bacterium]